MLNVEDNGLFEIFPMIETIATSFEYQNATLNKIVLTGKINALEIAENLFNFTEQTAQTFAELQAKLIEHLLEENKKEILLKSKTKTKILLHLLATSFENRKRDVEILSKDKYIIDYLTLKIEKEDITKRLEKYLEQHSLYNEIVILDPQGKVKINLNKDNRIRISRDENISKALKTDDVLQIFKKTDLFIKQKESLYFMKRIVKDDKVLGVIVLFYNLAEESNILFDSLVTEKETMIIVDRFNNILCANEKGLDKNFIKKINKVNDYMVINNRFYYKNKLDNLDDLYAIVSYPKRQDINIVSEFDNKNTNNRELIDIGINNKALKKLADDGYEILEDLSDVIINGELIAAKSKQYILIPILDNLREVSFRVVKLIELSISNLQKVINDSLKNHVLLLSKTIGDIVSRFLYERCLDVKWFAVDKDFMDLTDTSTINNKLQYLNTLYPMYKDIFVYDNNSKIVAISNSQHLIGDSVDHNYTSINKDANKCFISPFQTTKFYNNEPTYIVYASIIKDGAVIGGVGAVVDINSEFFKMLSVFEEGIVVIIDTHKKILASNSDEFNILSDFNLVDEVKEEVKDIKFNDKIYKLAISKSNGYRGYINNDLYVVMMLEK